MKKPKVIAGNQILAKNNITRIINRDIFSVNGIGSASVLVFSCSNASADNDNASLDLFASLPTTALLVCVLAFLIFFYWRQRILYRQLRLSTAGTEQELQKFLLAVEQSPSSVLITNAHGDIEFVNPKFCELSGYSQHRVVGQNVSRLRTENTPADLYREITNYISQGKIWRGEITQRQRDGNFFYSSITVRPIFDASDGMSHILFLHEDISDRLAYEESIFQQANYDTLTGLPNRALAMDRLEQAVNGAEGQRPLTLMCIDLDRFKIVNDTLGHQQGDKLLLEASVRLLGCVEEEDTVARIGGDEFLIILPDQISIANNSMLANRIIDSIDSPFFIDGHEINLTASIGLTVYPNDANNAAELLRNADAAMHTAKSKGHNTSHFYTPEMNRQALARLAMENELRHAVKRNELQLHYQPVLDGSTLELVAVESLVRWKNSRLGPVSSQEFISLAEETGQISIIGEWILQHACQQLVQWNKQGIENIRVAVNISSRQFVGGNIVTIIERVLSDTGLEPHRLELEITEGLLLDNSAQTLRAMKRLKMLGVRLALDDFGTGYSSLSYLKRFPFDVLKIDQAFIRNIDRDPENAALASAIIAMAHSLGLDVVAEGIEALPQQLYLQHQGCDLLQGYLYSKPLSADQIPLWLSQQQFSLQD